MKHVHRLLCLWFALLMLSACGIGLAEEWKTPVAPEAVGDLDRLAFLERQSLRIGLRFEILP